MKIYIIIVCHYMYYKNEINKKNLLKILKDVEIYLIVRIVILCKYNKHFPINRFVLSKVSIGNRSSRPVLKTI